MFVRIFAIAVFVTVFGSIGLGQPAPAQAESHSDDFANRFVVSNPPQPLPPFQFEDDKGVTHDLKDYQGHYILLNLWATWCGPCVKEMPSLDGLQKSLGARALIIALNEDRNGAAAAQAFYTHRNLTHLPVYIDVSGRAPYILHTPGLPATLLIDPQGKEIGHIDGDADWTDPGTFAFLKSQMKF
jgi:thiol-disulfide isomerase/thioredoxin